ncbi:hypothetical protein H072_2768 [Dactylellina haptotyla CBS 200.50]|uniref:Uncharacterized protein n=1 Tax=Dactylellina haptotyla (strain CBS 200.50) TaxID=1284197 RepID=S8BUS3_DACHA|nr:hypothetical protein H072_2768 [Dactylellina haptotyla CBS 200.50]
MHRLLTKKHRDDDHTKTPNKLRSFKRNKSQPPPASRPQVDLTQALPPTDDFRISLMMPNLEKRFSVLREGEQRPEDGPGAHGIGYGALASGTLFNDGKDGEFVRPPNNHNGLADITEIASIRSGSRAEGSLDLPENPMQNVDYGGSMMDRPRQGEGNILFGGRQKIFRVNTAATGSSDEAGDSPLSPVSRGRMGGRALYTDDLPTPGNPRKGSATEKNTARSQSPPPSNYNLDRNTQSSTTSGPSSLTRSSTTATSNSTNSRNFAPNVFVNPMTSTTSSKPRKLIYEQALDRDNSERELNMMETQMHLENQKLAIMAQKRAGSTSPHPYSEEDERRRAMSPQIRSFARPFSPHNEPEGRGRGIPTNTKPQASASLDNLRPQIPNLKTAGSSPALTVVKKASEVPFSFGFEDNSNSSKPSFPTLQASINNHGLPTPRPESEEYQSPQPSVSVSVSVNGLTPSASPLTERYSEDADISRDSQVNTEEAPRQPISRQSSASEYPSQEQAMEQQSTFYEASDSEREMDDGASSVYEDDPYIPFEDAFNTEPVSLSPPQKTRQIIPTFPPQKQITGTVFTPPSASDGITALHDSDSPTLPPNAGLSNMIRQHLRSDSGISSIYAPSTYGKTAEPQQEPPSLAQALANWGNEYPDYDEEAPFQPEAVAESTDIKPKFSLAELKKREADEKKLQQEQQPIPLLKSAPMERSRSDNTQSTGDDETDEWRTQLEEKKRMLQQRLQEHSGRNSPVPGFADSDEPPKNSILKPGMLGNMLKGKNSPSSTPGREEPKAMRMLGISPSMNRSGESFGRREDDEEALLDRHDEKFRPTLHRPDMHPQHDMRPRGPGVNPGQRMPPQGHPYGHPQGTPHGRPYPPHNSPPNQPHNGTRSFLPMTNPSKVPRKGAGHIPIESGIPSSSNMHREFVEQSRNGHRPTGPGMPPHMQHRGPPPHGHDHTGRPEFRPPHDRHHESRDPQQGGRSRARSNAQRPPNEAIHRSPPHSKAPMRRGPSSEEDLRGRHRGPPMGMPGMSTGVMTTVASGPTSPQSSDKKAPGKPKHTEPLQSTPSIPDLRTKNEPKPVEAPRDRRPNNLNIPANDVPPSRFSTEDSPQSSSFVGRFRSNSKSQKVSSISMFEQDNSSAPALPIAPKIIPTPTLTSNLSKPPMSAAANASAKTLAELTGSDGTNPAFQSAGAAAASREGKKTKIRKADISEPTLLSTTSQMPVSNLIDAGGKTYYKILPPGLSDSPQIRQRSGSDESASRVPHGPGLPVQNQRTSDPEGEKTRTLRKAQSDGSGLRERAASSARLPQPRPPMPTPSPYFGGDSRPVNSPPAPFFNNAPAGMI